MSKYRIVPAVNKYATGSNRNVWKIQKYSHKEGFFKVREVWEDVEWYEDYKLEYPNDIKMQQYMKEEKFYSLYRLPKQTYATEALAEAYIDKQLALEEQQRIDEQRDQKHLSIPPRGYP